jgi:phage terminase large subunit GpA-like protein
MSKTESLLNIIGHRLSDDPTPILFLSPTQKLTESVASDRVMKMFVSTPALWDRLAKGKQNKITEKFVSGVRLGFGWAGSGTELASHAVGLVLVDELDRMEPVPGEGDPVELARARVATYPDGRVCIVSSPTMGNVQTKTDGSVERWEVSKEVESPIWKLWQEGTRFEWAWPCPACDEYFIPRFKHLKWPEGCTPHLALKEARLACPHCGSLIDNSAKAEMNARGVYLAPGQRIENGAIVGDEPESDTASFWVSGLCSPWMSFGVRASDYLAAVESGDRNRVQAVVNTGFGELYSFAGEAPDWKIVADLREGYERGAVPEGVKVITCAVDVQKRRLVYAIRGWGYNFESWLIEHGEIWGETEYDAVWIELAKQFDRDFAGRRIRAMLVDSGNRTGDKERNDNQIYLFCRRFRGRAYATKGRDKLDKPFYASKIDVSYRGKIIKNGLDLWHLDTDYFKSWLYARLEWPHGAPGAWRLSKDADDDYCKQIVSEVRIVGPRGKVEWKKIRTDNHFLDVEAMNVAAAHILGVHTLGKPKEKEPEAEAGETPLPTPAPEQRQRVARRRGGWITAY